MSRSSRGTQGNDSSFSPFISADGSSVVFSSRASNLVANDTNEAFDVFRRNLLTGSTVRLAADDAEFNFDVIGSDITPDGLVVSLLTGADLLAEDVNFAFDVYVLDSRPAADLAVTKTDSPDPVAVRANLTYTVTVHNNGPGAASGVVLTDQLPAEAVFVSATAIQGSCTRAGKGSRGGVLTCSLGTINAFGTATVTIVVQPSSGGVLTNTATVRANSPDPDPSNNTATATTTAVK